MITSAKTWGTDATGQAARTTTAGASEGGVSRGRPGYSREDIIRAAVREFNTRGYEATSMGTVAKGLGITKSALYHHVSSKEEILELTVAKALHDLREVMETAEGMGASAGEQLRVLLRGSVEVLCRDPESVALLLRLRGNSEAENRAMERRRELTRAVVELIAKGQADGTVRDDCPPILLGRMVFGLVNSVAEWYRPTSRFSPEEITRTAEAVLFTGMAGAAPSAG